MLGIESSCDDTAAAVVTEDLDVLSNVISSQMEIHNRYGGVVPEIASRVHVAEIVPVIDAALKQAHARPRELSAISVTKGPGLIGSLLVGIAAAKGLALVWKKPIIAVNHLEGHLASVGFGGGRLTYPVLVLLVSGGHTLLARTTAPGTHQILGATRDDSVGEAYDKVSCLLNLGYPGGPIVDRMALKGTDRFPFPRPLLKQGLDFSFSGLKSAVAHHLRKSLSSAPEDVAASFATAVMDVLLEKIAMALAQAPYGSLAVVGGVAASPILRERLADLKRRTGVEICLPPLKMATDNAAMIAAAAWPRFRSGAIDSLDFGADPGLSLSEGGGDV